jgi:hypothetical protein
MKANQPLCMVSSRILALKLRLKIRAFFVRVRVWSVDSVFGCRHGRLVVVNDDLVQFFDAADSWVR